MRALEREFGRPIGVLQDLQGLKIRIGFVESGKLMLDTGETVRFARRSRRRKTVDPSTSSGNIRSRGSRPGLLIDDGRVRPSVKKPGDGEMVARIVVGGMIRDHKGINLPGTLFDVSPLTKKDLAFGLELDWVALSFVQKPSDLIEAPALIGDAAGLIDKIETHMALDRIDDIIHLSDAIMVARGDFGVEIPSEEVRGRQKELIRACRPVAKPVIAATKMLDSMVAAPMPTRAEASDVATALYDGADAVMLSAESASGGYPGEESP